MGEINKKIEISSWYGKLIINNNLINSILILLTNLATQMSWIFIIQQFWGLLEVKEARGSPFFFIFNKKTNY